MATGTAEDLQKRLTESEGKTAKLKTILVALKTKSSEVQALCQQQREQLEKDRLTIENLSREEARWQRRCQELETRNKELERDKAERDQLGARQAAVTEQDVLRDFQRGLAHKRQAEGGGEDAVVQSAVSVCEGALGILKAALAGALTSTQTTNNAAGSLSLEPDLAGSGRAANNFERNVVEEPLASCSGKHLNAAEPKESLRRVEAPFRGRKRSADELEDAVCEAAHMEGHHRIKAPKVEESIAEGQTAMDIGQHWLARLMQRHHTQRDVDHVASRIFAEVKVTKRCPVQCFTTCVVLSLINCASGNGSLCDSLWQDSSNDTASSKSPAASLCMLEGTQIEDVLLSKAWYAPEQARMQSLTTLLACIASLDKQARSLDPASSGEFSQAVEEELRRMVLIEHRQRSAALECEDCALTTALVLLLRMQGKLQAARTFLLDFLASSVGSVEQMLPCIAATFAAWPDLLGDCTSGDNEPVKYLLQEGLQAVCQGVVQDLDGDSQDASTSAGSMSGTTLPAASRGGPAVACRYLLQLGKARWGWQDNPGSLQDIQPKLQDICKALYTDSLRPGARHSLNDRGLGSWTCSCYISVRFLGLPWICEEVISKMEPLSLPGKTSDNSRVSQVTAEHVLQKLLDLFQISQIESGMADQQLQKTLTDFCASDACPQPVAARIRRLLLV